MLNKVNTTAAILGMTFFVSTTAHSQEVNIQQLTDSLMQRAGEVVEQQIKQQLEQTVMDASDLLTLDQQQQLPESEIVIQTEDAPVIIAANGE